MIRSRGDMTLRRYLALLAALSFTTFCYAGPLGPLPNVTSSDLGLKEGSCAVGDLVYMPGDEFPGASACERCTCSGGAVRCAKQRCESRPGCKALHRPDHCCPIYQCECEQEGRVYGNGEKLVDPLDPCRVCYCQGGEVVCRRIACFVRDDCRPRLVPGRCCPEYDNCPLRGVTTVPGMTPIPSVSSVEDVASSPAPPAPKENVKQEITIKEITPVSEIPVITEVKIKEILPSPSIEVAEYSSSKSPLIVREATSEKSATYEADSNVKTEAPVIIEVQPSSSSISISSLPPEVPSESSETISTNDLPPSKISFSIQDSINSEIYPSVLTSAPTMGAPSITPEFVKIASTTKAPIIEEEDPSMFDHNPAFPPIPDDLSVLSNHEDDIAEQTADGDHVSMTHELLNVATASPATETVTIAEPLTTTVKEIETTLAPTSKVTDISEGSSPLSEFMSTTLDSTISTEITSQKQSPMLNLRSAIPTEILNIPSFVPEDITGELDEATELTTTSKQSAPVLTSSGTEKYSETEATKEPELPVEVRIYSSSTTGVTETAIITQKPAETTAFVSSSQAPQEQTTNYISKSNIATEITAQTELSSLPIETSDQNPHDISENIAKEKAATSTSEPLITELPTSKIPSSIESEVITVSRAVPSGTDNQSFENVETTEFILTSFGSSESATDAVELIKISAEPEKSAPIIEHVERRKNNVLYDLINLVGDVASIGDHTEHPSAAQDVTSSTIIPDSEELIPVNAGYKSKNSNRNVNSITEIPVKSKSQIAVNKQKVVEIEDDDNITDSPPPNDKIEPTTRRPIIDNVSDDNMPENKTETKDVDVIEIIKSYVPTINRRPTKVVMKKSNEKPTSEEIATEGAAVSASSEFATENNIDVSSEFATVEPDAINSEVGERTADTTAAP